MDAGSKPFMEDWTLEPPRLCQLLVIQVLPMFPQVAVKQMRYTNPYQLVIQKYGLNGHGHQFVD